MHIETALYNYLASVVAITALVSDRIYMDVAAEGAAMPYLVFTRVSTVPDYLMGGQSGLTTARFQFDAISDEKMDVMSVAEQLRLALSGYGPATMGGAGGAEVDWCSLELMQDDFADETGRFSGIYRRLTDYYIHYRETVPSL